MQPRPTLHGDLPAVLRALVADSTKCPVCTGIHPCDAGCVSRAGHQPRNSGDPPCMPSEPHLAPMVSPHPCEWGSAIRIRSRSDAH